MTEKSRYMYITEPDASVIDHRPISSYRLYGREKIKTLITEDQGWIRKFGKSRFRD